MKSRETNQKPIRRVLQCTMMAVIASGIAGCSDFQRAIGSKKSSPDEFEVVVRPPLSLPPGFANTPDDIRQEEETASQDSLTLAGKSLGSGNAYATGYDALFDFASVPDNIRERVDEETYGIQLERRVPAQIVFGGLPDIGPILDKVAEDQRIRKNLREGLLPTDGDILATDEASGETLIIK
jgi:hypothetical protein